jgi:hypothetical protein
MTTRRPGMLSRTRTTAAAPASVCHR